jgi:hypothetical protein
MLDEEKPDFDFKDHTVTRHHEPQPPNCEEVKKREEREEQQREESQERQKGKQK